MEAIYEFIDAETSETALHGAMIWPARFTVWSAFLSAAQSFRKARNFAICFLGRN
jgi:hypothetical protein